MLKKMLLIGACVAPFIHAAPALAADGEADWFIRPGITALDLADNVESLTAGGAIVPGADMSTETHFTPTVQVGRFIAAKAFRLSSSTAASSVRLRSMNFGELMSS